MERRRFLKLAFGVAAGATAFAAGAKAAPFTLHPLLDERLPAVDEAARPAVVTGDEVAAIKPEEIRWGHHWHRGWHRHRHWGWHRRHWGWRRRHWHRRHWRRRYW